MPKPKTSGIWKYYTEISAQEARCKLCEFVVQRGKRASTSGMIRHLEFGKAF